MRNLFYLFICFFVLACTNNNQPQEEKKTSIITNDSLNYQYHKFELKHSKCVKLPDSACNAYVKATYPVFKEENANINLFIDTLLSYDPSSENPKVNGLENAAKSFLASYSSLLKDDPNLFPGYTWEQDIKINNQINGLVTLTYFSNTYMGGAHGSQETYFYNYDLTQHKILSLDNLLITNYSQELTKIAEEIFRKNEGLSVDDDLRGYFFENQKFVLNNNFLITKEGLLFLYNNYEIKAYAFGTTELLIPYSQIKKLVKPNGQLKTFIN